MNDWRLLAVVTLLPLLAEVLLFKFNVPLGKPGKFVYLYSPVAIAPRRLAAVPYALLIAGVLACGVRLLFSAKKRSVGAGALLVMVGCLAGAGWAYLAPPQFRSQHVFNMHSPSHDGAFLTEASYVRRLGVRSYLRDFPARARTPPAEMRGTRVISNPPGTTLLAVGTLGLLDRFPALARAVYALGGEEDLPPEGVSFVNGPTAFSCVLVLLWLLAAPFLYSAARVLLPMPVAVVFALVCLFSPMTLLFVPGKDPVQLLTVALPLWLWLLAWRGERVAAAALAGGAFVVACLASLVHVWIAAVVFAATVFSTARGARLRIVGRYGLTAACGALVVIGALALLADFDVFASAWAAARAQSEITRGAEAMPLHWQILGVPLFLLFAGPALWFLTIGLPRRRLRDAGARFGLWLLLGSAAVMIGTVGFTNVETPRLWIPFGPLLVLGAALQLPAIRFSGKRAATLLAALVFVQFSASALQWSLMDMRESETRLLQREGAAPRFYQ